MPNGGVTKVTFDYSTTDVKLSILYDQQTEIIKSIAKLQEKDDCQTKKAHDQWFNCDKRFKNLERGWYKVVGIIVFISLLSPFLAAYLQASL